MYKKENRTLPINSVTPAKYEGLEKIKKIENWKSVNRVVRQAIDDILIKYNIIV